MLVPVVTTLLFVLTISASEEASGKKNWDFLVFSQHWPITVCTQWKEEKGHNKCTLPPKENLWTIHGIWPTKDGKEGPFMCNKTWHFDLRKLEPILPDLELYWVNVEANTPVSSLWQHEWDKHGTCAALLPALGSELKFFQKGLEWTQEYKMAEILAKSSISPQPAGYPVKAIYDSVKGALDANPVIECVIDKRTKQSMLSEIRICFDKNLTLMDCDMAKAGFAGDGKGILTNCDLKKPVLYLDKVPDAWYDYRYIAKLYRWYNFVQYLIRVTL